MRVCLIGFWVLIFSGMAVAQSGDRETYRAAEDFFNAQKVAQRLETQMMMAVSGFLKSSFDTTFSANTFEAVRAFQVRNDWPDDGRLTALQVADLRAKTLSGLMTFAFAEIGHPRQKHPIWIPMGLGLEAFDEAAGTLWHNADRSFAIAYRYHEGRTVHRLLEMETSLAAENNARIVHRSATKAHFETITEFPKGEIAFTTYYAHKGGSLGLTVVWKPSIPMSTAIPTVVMASSTLAASLSGTAFPKGPKLPAEVGAIYARGQQTFQQLTPTARQSAQIMLAASGYLTEPIDDTFTGPVSSAIATLQNAYGLPPTGILDVETATYMEDAARPGLAVWGFTEVPHPSEGKAIWIPAALDLDVKSDAIGLTLSAKKSATEISYNYSPSVTVKQAYDRLLAASAKGGDTLEVSVLRKTSFIIQSKLSSGGHLRWVYHRHKTGVLGTAVFWMPGDSAHMEQAQIIMEASLTAVVTGKPFPSPDRVLTPAIEAAAATPENAQPSTDDAEAKGGVTAGKGVATGTGFFVSRDGHVLTNAHVVDGCSEMVVSAGLGAGSRGELVARDETNDLALLKTGLTGRQPPALRATARLGDPVAAFGFPLAGTLTQSGNFTLGNITATSGMQDDSRFFQISAPVQPGNSGGALMDMQGRVLGVVTAKLNAIEMASVTKDIPQNVNFAIKGGLAINFLESHDISVTTADHSATISSADLADRIRAISAFITCERDGEKAQ
jgi:S1-C subfamily serine protease/peptidoglycan hydrolase-like protein with peptidoglycan-binding domain